MIKKNSLSVSWLVSELTSPRLDWPRVGLLANCPVSLVTLSSRHCQISEEWQFVVPRRCTKFSLRAFSFSGPVAWNSLPAECRHPVHNEQTNFQNITEISFLPLSFWYFIVTANCLLLGAGVHVLIVMGTLQIYIDDDDDDYTLSFITTRDTNANPTTLTFSSQLHLYKLSICLMSCDQVITTNDQVIRMGQKPLMRLLILTQIIPNLLPLCCEILHKTIAAHRFW